MAYQFVFDFLNKRRVADLIAANMNLKKDNEEILKAYLQICNEMVGLKQDKASLELKVKELTDEINSAKVTFRLIEKNASKIIRSAQVVQDMLLVTKKEKNECSTGLCLTNPVENEIFPPADKD